MSATGKQRRRRAWLEARDAMYNSQSFAVWLKALDVFVDTPEFSMQLTADGQSKWVRVKESAHGKFDLSHNDPRNKNLSQSVISRLSKLYEDLESGQGPVVCSLKENGHKFMASVVKLQVSVNNDKPVYDFVLRFERISQELEF